MILAIVPCPSSTRLLLVPCFSSLKAQGSRRTKNLEINIDILLKRSSRPFCCYDDLTLYPYSLLLLYHMILILEVLPFPSLPVLREKGNSLATGMGFPGQDGKSGLQYILVPT
jgi:hypothetical protein